MKEQANKCIEIGSPDCCTHYKTNEYEEGYLFLPWFNVKVCCNCDAMILEWSNIKFWIFDKIISIFWDGTVKKFSH